MVQITLAFVIILGYLVSKGISDSRGLAQRIAEQEQVNARLEQVVNTFAESETGRERIQRIETQRQLQIQTLLNQWLRIREERRFYRLVQLYRNAELVQLSDDPKSLPVESSFTELNQEIDRIFLFEKEKVSPVELRKLVNEVVSAAKFDLADAAKLMQLQQNSPEAAALYDDPRHSRGKT